MFKQIIVPIDINSKDSWNLAIKQSAIIAKTFDAELHFITVVPDYGLSMIQEYFPKDWVGELIKKSQIELAKIIEFKLKEEIRHKIIVERGAVYQIIIDYANKVKADLIVMAAHHPNRSDYLLGPNTAKVARHSTTSVLVVREE